MNWNWLTRPDLLILFLVLGASFLQWAYGKAQEQKEITRRKRESQRKRDDLMRQGKLPSERSQQLPQQRAAPQAQPRTQASTDQQARQERLRELRRQQLEQLRQRQRAQASTTPQRSAQRAQRPPTAQPTRHTGRQAPQKTQPASKPSASQRRATAKPTSSATPQQDRVREAHEARERDRQQAYLEQARQRELPRGSISESPPLQPVNLAPQPIDPYAIQPPRVVDIESWRRAVITMEILSRPIALRPADHNAF